MQWRSCQQQCQAMAGDATAANAHIKRSVVFAHGLIVKGRAKSQARHVFLTFYDMTQPQTASRDVQARIERLFIYPIKSCAGVEVKDAVLLDTGLDLDRAWMVVDAHGEFVTQRESPRMALVQPQLKQHEMILRAPGMLALHISIDAVEGPITVKVWDDTVPAFDMGDLAAQWFTDFLSMMPAGLPSSNAKKHRLVRFDPDHQRLSSKKWTDGADVPNQFSDGFPVLVLSLASLDGLNERLVQAGHAAVGIERFRPNIVISGVLAHDEDRMTAYYVQTEAGEFTLKPVKPCPRCPMPNVNPATATTSPEVGDVLQAYRQNPLVDGAVTFGMNAYVLGDKEATLRVGQAVSGDFDF